MLSNQIEGDAAVSTVVFCPVQSPVGCGDAVPDGIKLESVAVRDYSYRDGDLYLLVARDLVSISLKRRDDAFTYKTQNVVVGVGK